MLCIDSRALFASPDFPLQAAITTGRIRLPDIAVLLLHRHAAFPDINPTEEPCIAVVLDFDLHPSTQGLFDERYCLNNTQDCWSRVDLVPSPRHWVAALEKESALWSEGSTIRRFPVKVSQAIHVSFVTPNLLQAQVVPVPTTCSVPVSLSHIFSSETGDKKGCGVQEVLRLVPNSLPCTSLHASLLAIVGRSMLES